MFPQFWSYLLKKSLKENFIFCAVLYVFWSIQISIISRLLCWSKFTPSLSIKVETQICLAICLKRGRGQTDNPNSPVSFLIIAIEDGATF